MKDYFTRLFNYDHYANHILTATIIKAGNPLKSVQLMAHLLAAQQIWLARCKGAAATGIALWPDWPAETLDQLIDQNHSDLISYLNDQTIADFDKTVAYENSKGEKFENKLVDLLVHLINHGTHHRAQAGQVIKFTGVEGLPNTDYIIYLRAQQPTL